jgi:hypothetical protein
MNTERLHEFKCRTQGPTRMMMMMLRCCCLLKKMLLLFLLIAIASLVSTFLHQASSEIAEIEPIEVSVNGIYMYTLTVCLLLKSDMRVLDCMSF